MPGAFWQPQKNGPFFLAKNPIFASKKGALVFFSLLGAVVAALILSQVIYGATPKGDTSQWNPYVFTQDEGGLSNTQINEAMMLVKQEFKKEFVNCSLGWVIYDQEQSDAVSQKLKNRYSDQGLAGTPFVITSTFSTGKQGVPADLEPNRDYQDYQWILAVAKVGDNSQLPTLLDQGFGLVELPEREEEQ